MTSSIDISSLFQQAKTLYHQQKYHRAEEVMSHFIQQQTPNVESLYLMAKIKESFGSYLEQIEFLAQALALSPESSEYSLEIALAYFRLCDFNKAYEYANLSANNKNNSVELLGLLGKIYYDLGRYDRSIKVLQSAIILNKHDEHLFYSLGTALTLTGKIDESVNAYQRSIKLNPHFSLAYVALSKARKSTINDNNIEKLQALAIKDRNPWTSINIYHGLAKELDDIGKYKEAFEALTRGKRKLRTACPHRPTTPVDNISRLKTLYSNKADDINQNSLSGASNKAPIFVTGMPRTGTTIVERILTNAVDVNTVGERIQFSALLKQQCQGVYSTLIDAEKLENSWAAIDFNKLGHDYVNSIKYLTNNDQRFVDKLPLNILLAGVILKALPHANIVCLMRDPLDTIIGNYRQIFEQASGTYAYTLDLNTLANYVYEFRQLVKRLQQLFPERFLVVNYEELVDNPLCQAKKLFNFCDLKWQDKYLDIHKNTAAIGTASAAQVQEPIHKKSLGHSQHYQFCLAQIKAAFQQKEGGDNVSV